MHAAVLAHFHKIGMPGEVVVLPMFQNHDAVIFQQSCGKHHIGDCRQRRQCVWGIGKDNVEFTPAGVYVFEGIGLKHRKVVDS